MKNGIRKRGRIAVAASPPPKRARAKKRPNFAARLKRIYGDKVLSGDVVVEDRDSRPY
jgi:hypothetical protein